jgi:four helix bundle protein
MHDYRRLEVWRRSHELALAIYRATTAYPRHEGYGLTSQMRRAAASIPANLAEGSGRRSNADFARFIDYSIGSSTELEYEIHLSRDLGYLTDETSAALREELAEIRGMLSGLSSRLLREGGQTRRPGGSRQGSES